MKVIVILFSIIFCFCTILVYLGFALPFNQVNCGSQKYVIYNDLENPYYMYNINNSKMFWKFTSLGKSIHYSEVENGISTELHIHKNGTKIPFEVESSGTVNSEYYSKFLENKITFLPTNNILTQQDIQNLKACYPNAVLELESNITRNGSHIGGQFELIK